MNIINIEKSDSMIIKQAFSNNLVRFMNIYNMNQDDIAKCVGVTQQSVSNWINCKQIPRMYIIENLARNFGILKSDLIEVKENKSMKQKGFIIPVLGVVPCGIPIDAIEDIIDFEEISEKLADTGKFFGLKAKGDSMSPLIMEGDTLIIKQQDFIDHGQIAIVKVNGEEATCKKVMKSELGITLIPINSAHDPLMFSVSDIKTEPLIVVGRVIEIRRSL